MTPKARKAVEPEGQGRFSLDEAFSTIRALSHRGGAVLQEVRPSKASVTYGLELEVQNGSLMATLVRGSGKASFEITLEWERGADA
jgi:hypothetical protein